jgi:hypothetical protein
MLQLNKALSTLIVLFLAVIMSFGGSTPFFVNAAGISPYYSIAFAKNNLIVHQGQVFTAVLSVYAVSSLQTIALYYSGSFPASNITASLSPSYGTPDFNSTVTIFVPATTVPGNYSLRFVGNDGYYKVSTRLNITVLKSTFYVKLNPNSSTVHAGGSASFTATAYSNIVPQTVNWSYSAPKNISVSLSAQASEIGQPITVTVFVPPNTALNGRIPITMFAKSNDSFVADATFMLTITKNVTILFNASGLSTSVQGVVLTVNNKHYFYSQLPATVSVQVGTMVSYSWASPLAGGTNSQFTWVKTVGLATAQNGKINATTSGTVTAIYQARYYLNVVASPPNGGTVSPQPGWYNAGARVQISAAPKTGYLFAKWLGSGNVSYSGSNSTAIITMNGPITETAIFNKTVVVINFTARGLNSNAEGVVLKVNGQSLSYLQLPYMLVVPYGAAVSYSWSTPISGGATAQFTLANVSGLENSQSATFMPIKNGSIIATYVEQPLVIFKANGLNNNAKGTVLLVNGQNYTYSQLPVTIRTKPGAAINFTWVSPVSGGTGTRFVWVSTSGLSTSQSGTIIMPSSGGVVSATYQLQYYLSTRANPTGGGKAFPQSGWYNAGAHVQISAIPNGAFVFSNWSGAGLGSYSGPNANTTITMNSPVTEVANFKLAILFPVLTVYDAANVYNDYNYQFAVVGQAVFQDPVPFANKQLTLVISVTSGATGTTYNKTITVTTNSQGWFYSGVQTINGGLSLWGKGEYNKELYIYYNGTLVKQLGGWAWGDFIPSVEAQGGALSISAPAWDGLQLYSNITSTQSVLLPAGITVLLNTTPLPGNYFEQYAFYGGHNNAYLLLTSGQKQYEYTLPPPVSYTGLTQVTEIVSRSAQAQMTFVVSIPLDTMANVTITLYGPHGYKTSWSGRLVNIPHVNEGEASHTFTGLAPGNYVWVITPPNVTNIYNPQEVYYPIPSAGEINDNSSESVNIVYGGQLYNVTFFESGLPNGTLWYVNLNGINISSKSPTITFTGVPSGVFTFTAGPQYYYVSSNTRYYGGGSGSISVNTNTQQTISWIKQYEVTTKFKPPSAYSTGVEPAPNSNGVAEVWVNNGASLTVIGAPADYWVAVWPFQTSPSITPTSAGYTQTGGVYYYQSQYTITQSENITVQFEKEEIDVQESGLPSGIIWYALYGGQQWQSTAGVPIEYIPWNGNNSDTTVSGSIVSYKGVYYIPTNVAYFPISEKYNEWQTETINYIKTYTVRINAGYGGNITWTLLNGTGAVYVPSLGFINSSVVKLGTVQTLYVTSGTELQLTVDVRPTVKFLSWSFSGYVGTTQAYYRDNSANPIDVVDGGGSGSVSVNYKYPPLKVTLSVSPTQGPAPLTVTYTANATGGSGYYKYSFYYLNNHGYYMQTAFRPSNTFTYTYREPALIGLVPSTKGLPWYKEEFPAAVIVEDVGTGEQVMSNYVYVNVTAPPLIAKISAYPTSGNVPLGVQFYSNVTGGVGGYTYFWTYGQMTGYGPNPYLTFSIPGTYTIQLEVQSGLTLNLSNTITITATLPPLDISLNASPPTGQAPLTVTFTALASSTYTNEQYNFYYMNNSGVYTWSGWQTSNTFTYTYNHSGVYYAEVEVKGIFTRPDGWVWTQTAYSNFVQVTVSPPYSYTFYESGLPSNTVWSVTMNGQTKFAGAGDSITFTGLAGSNSWSAPAVTVYEGPSWHKVSVTYYPSPQTGTVNGSGSETISYST